jgi:hypothetical protein
MFSAFLGATMQAQEPTVPSQTNLFVSNSVDNLEEIRAKAEKGDAAAQFILGFDYQKGKGVKQDYTEAAMWYRKSAEQGDASAQFYLGLCYADGGSVGQDAMQAVNWYRKAAEQGDAPAQANLGYCYAKGNGVQQDYSEAVKWYRKAADQGEARAQVSLGYCYDTGRGVDQDHANASNWYRKAADQGNADGQSNLGACYANGTGVIKDYVEAYKWDHLASAQGSETAKQFLQHLEQRMTPEQIADGQRLAREFNPRKVKRTSAGSARMPRTAAYVGVGQKHWIKSNADNGNLIQLEDGSFWQISPLDQVKTILWLPTNSVDVIEGNSPLYPYKLIGRRSMAEANRVSGAQSISEIKTPDGEIDLYDSNGRAVAYIPKDDDMTIYLWSGQPCAYLDDEEIYGFNGNHLGWFRSGVAYDHAGDIVAAVADKFHTLAETSPLKGLQHLKPLKSLKELKPLKPGFSIWWSKTPAKDFFLKGAD